MPYIIATLTILASTLAVWLAFEILDFIADLEEASEDHA